MFILVSQGRIMNYENMLTLYFHQTIQKFKSLAKEKMPTFYMYSYLIDVVCVLVFLLLYLDSLGLREFIIIPDNNSIIRIFERGAITKETIYPGKPSWGNKLSKINFLNIDYPKEQYQVQVSMRERERVSLRLKTKH